MKLWTFRTIFCLRSTFTLISMIAVGQTANSKLASAQMNPDSFVFSEKESLLVLPPTFVSGSTSSMSWSSDSLRLITLNSKPYDLAAIFDHPDRINDSGSLPPEFEFSIGRWNRLNHNSDTIWKRRFPTQPSTAGEIQWIARTQLFGQIIYWQSVDSVPNGNGGNRINYTQNQELLLVDAARSTVREIRSIPNSNFTASPTKALAVLVGFAYPESTERATLISIRPDGTSSDPVELPVRAGVGGFNWSKDGSKLIVAVLKIDVEKKALATTFVSFDPVTRELKPVPADTPKTPDLSAPAEGPLMLRSTVQHVKYVDADTITHPLWLESKFKSDRQRTMVSSDADMQKLSPDCKTIAFRTQGASYVSEIKPVPLAEFIAARNAALKATIMSNAKQLGLAAIMWAQDHDETLPTPNGINGELLPYVKNDILFGGFNYTFAGGSLASINAPSETILGTVDGPGGQAVIYTDGHVKWQNK